MSELGKVRIETGCYMLCAVSFLIFAVARYIRKDSVANLFLFAVAMTLMLATTYWTRRAFKRVA